MIEDRMSLTRRLEDTARKFRVQILRMVTTAGSGHIGPSFSIIDVLTALYFHYLCVNPQDPRWPARDRVILSKGHAAPALYAVLAQKGYFPEKWLSTLRALGSALQGYPDRCLLAGIDASAGPLGHGLSVGIGMALAGRLRGWTNRVYVILGDGELNEGQVWEAAMAAGHWHVANLVAIVDRNRLQLDGPTDEIMHTDPLGPKWAAFGWNVVEIDGHAMPAILDAFDSVTRLADKPSVIIAHTVKGKAVSFMEGNNRFHFGLPTGQETAQALRELLTPIRV